MTVKKPLTVYWDANAFLTLLKKEAGYIDCEQVVEAAERGEIKIVTSAISLIEVIKLKSRTPMTEADEELIRAYFESSYITVHSVDRSMAESARNLIWKYGVEPKDAIHVATALTMVVDEMHTADKKLLGLNGQDGLLIVKPGLREPELPSI